MKDIVHIPVMVRETLSYLDPKPGGHIIDGTVGQGGHAEFVLSKIGSDGRILGIDRDPRNLAVAKQRFARFEDRVIFVQGSYADAREIAKEYGVAEVDGVLLDLGFSSAHIEDPERGFSFQTEGPLDMRYDPSQELTASEIVNGWNPDELAEVIRVYGEERNAKKIASAIVAARKQEKITTTTQLAEVIARALPRRGRIHPATKTFQALRIAVNDELGELKRALPMFVDLLKPGGRLVVISFHSLEDRIIKQFLKSDPRLSVLTKKVVKPSEDETNTNPRARSAKLRAAEKQ